MLVRRLGFPRFPLGEVGELERLQREMGRLFDALSHGERDWPGAGVFPAINVTQDPQTLYLRAELPGVDPKQLEITATKNKITISGERELEEEGAGVSYHRREREGGRFSRTLVVPTEFSAEKIDASYRHGLLTITLPKAEEAKPRQIAVKTA